jgi:hypothetical protein
MRNGDRNQARDYFTHCAAIRLKGYLDALDRLSPEDRVQAMHERIGLMLAQARAGMQELVRGHVQELITMAERGAIPGTVMEGSQIFQACAAGLGILSQTIESKDGDTQMKLREEAKGLLLKAIELGYNDRDYLMTDPDFEWISQSNDWIEVDSALSR